MTGVEIMEHNTVEYIERDGPRMDQTEHKDLHYTVVSCYALHFGLYIYCTLSLVLL